MVLLTLLPFVAPGQGRAAPGASRCSARKLVARSFPPRPPAKDLFGGYALSVHPCVTVPCDSRGAKRKDLTGGPATVDRLRRAGDAGGGFAAQEGGEGSHFGGVKQAFAGGGRQHDL